MSLKMYTLAFIVMSACASVSYAQDVEEAFAEGRDIVFETPPPDPKMIKELTSTVYNFKKACDKKIVLFFNDKQINIKRLKLSEEEATIIASDYLMDETLAARMDVWCKTAKLQKELAMDMDEEVPKNFDIKDLNLIDDVAVSYAEIDDVLDGDRNPENGMRTIKNDDKKEKNSRSRTGRKDKKSRNGKKDKKSRKEEKAKRRQKRKVLNYNYSYWPNGIIRWKIAIPSQWNAWGRNALITALDNWERDTCLDFQETTATTGSLINIVRQTGCWSYVGKQPNPQSLSLGVGCVNVGTITHEIGHAIGLAHEQSRPDRNAYVTINWQNIVSGKAVNFYAKGFGTYVTHGVPYDYTSIMHYGSNAFVINYNAHSIYTKDTEMQSSTGQRTGVSFYDVKAVNKKYCEGKCPGHTTLEWDQCKNNGYRNPKKCNECICPSGLSKTDCVDPIQSTACGTTNVFTAAENVVKTFSPPGYANINDHPLNSLCAYKFKAPEGMAVKMKVLDLKMPAKAGANCAWYLEVRHENLALNGPRFCSWIAPTEEFVSHGNELLLTMFTNDVKFQGFKVEFTAERCGGCSVGGTATAEPACLQTDLYNCATAASGPNTCFDAALPDKMYCCDGYELVNDVCIAAQTVYDKCQVLSDLGIPATTTTSTTTTTTTTTTTASP